MMRGSWIECTATQAKSIVACLIFYVFLQCYSYDKTFSIKDSNEVTQYQYLAKDSSTIALKNSTEDHALDYESCITNDTLPENWCEDMNKVPRYVGKEDWPPRSIQHYTHEGYEHCLANKTVVFIGDSRVRYQFMHLARYLESKKRMKCQDYGKNADDECYLINEKKLDIPWNLWYEKSTAELLSPVQTSLCDCYRSPDFMANATFENRFIRRSTAFGDINLIYLECFEDFIQMNEDYPPFTSFLSTPKRCKAGECGVVNRTNAFTGSLKETLWNILPRLNATHAFVNHGWDILDFSCELQEFEKDHPDIKTFYLSHPLEKQFLTNPLAQFDAKSLKCGDSNLLDRTIMNKNVPRTWYWDWMHVLSILNEEYNHLAMEMICPIKK